MLFAGTKTVTLFRNYTRKIVMRGQISLLFSLSALLFDASARYLDSVNEFLTRCVVWSRTRSTLGFTITAASQASLILKMNPYG